MVTRSAQRLWCNVQRVQRSVYTGFKGLWAPNKSSTTSSTSPLTSTQASVTAAAIFQASAAPHMSPGHMHQPMMQQFRSGGPPSVRPLHGTAGYSSTALQQDRIAGGHGSISAAAPDLDLASDGDSEQFEDAVEVMQPDLLQTEAPLQVQAAANHLH